MVWYTFEGPGPRLRHALLSRQGGVSKGPFASLNLGSTVGDDSEAVAENHQRVLKAFGITRAQVISPHQVHKNQVTQVSDQDGGHIIPETDALMTNEPGLAILMRFADCTPVLLYDPARQAIALAHAGWRGVASMIISETVHAMAAAFGTQAGDLWAGVGPAIGPEHYAVGPEVVQAVRATLPHGAQVVMQREDTLYLDLAGAVIQQLRMAGVTQIEASELCTACRTDEWYSHRAEKGHTGRFGVLVMLER